MSIYERMGYKPPPERKSSLDSSEHLQHNFLHAVQDVGRDRAQIKKLMAQGAKPTPEICQLAMDQGALDLVAVFLAHKEVKVDEKMQRMAIDRIKNNPGLLPLVIGYSEEISESLVEYLDAREAVVNDAALFKTMKKLLADKQKGFGNKQTVSKTAQSLPGFVETSRSKIFP